MGICLLNRTPSFLPLISRQRAISPKVILLRRFLAYSTGTGLWGMFLIVAPTTFSQSKQWK